MVKETLEKLILLQIGAAAATQEKIEEVISQLIEQGRITREEGKKTVDEVMERAKDRTSNARMFFDASVQQGMRQAGLPTRQDYDDLLFRVEQLEHRVRLLEDQAQTPPPLATEPPPAL